MALTKIYSVGITGSWRTISITYQKVFQSIRASQREHFAKGVDLKKVKQCKEIKKTRITWAEEALELR